MGLEITDLEALMTLVDEELRRRFSRSLPFADGAFDRWERAQRLGFGDRSSIYNSALVFEPVTVGTGTWIGPNVLLDGSGGGLAIGAWCSIAAGAQIYTHDTVRWALSGGEVGRETAPTSIGDCCYVGPLSIVSAGITIGSQSVVAANSYVNSDVPSRTIVGGSPARVIGSVEGEGQAVRLVF